MTAANPLRGAQISVSLPLFLDLIGLDHGSIHLGAAGVDFYYPDTLFVVLRGDDKRLPLADRGRYWPTATVVLEQRPDLPGVRGRLEWGRPA